MSPRIEHPRAADDAHITESRGTDAMPAAVCVEPRVCSSREWQRPRHRPSIRHRIRDGHIERIDLQQQRLPERSLVLTHLAADEPAVRRQPPVGSADLPAVVREVRLLKSTRTGGRETDGRSTLREGAPRGGSHDQEHRRSRRCSSQSGHRTLLLPARGVSVARSNAAPRQPHM
jgi:hypothetical protein